MIAKVWFHRHEYDVAHVDVYSGLAFLWAEAVTFVLRRLGRSYVLTLHGGGLPAFARRWPRRTATLLRHAQTVTSPSRYLVEEFKLFREDLVWVKNAIDLSRYDYRERTQPSPHLVWMRAFHDIYNPMLLPDVLALLASEFPSIRATMIGPDKGDGSLQATFQRAQEKKVCERITYAGPVPKADVPRWLNEGDIFLNTTTVDNAPVTLVEAMACGLCVVSTNVGGVPYLVEHEKNALLVPTGDAIAMSNSVRRLLCEAGLARRLSEQGRAHAETFSWAGALTQWDGIFRQAIARS